MLWFLCQHGLLWLAAPLLLLGIVGFAHDGPDPH
jgi:hypothetical protein